MGNSRAYYDEYWRTKRITYTLSPKKRRVFTQHIHPSATVLDVGCGNGEHYGKFFAKASKRYVGIDVSKEAVALARKNGIDARVWDFEKPFPFANRSFDVVLCIENLEHLFAPERTLREIFRVLKKGGTAIISVPNAAWWVDRLLLLFGRFNPRGRSRGSRQNVWEDPHIRFFTKATLVQMLERAGFTVERVYGEPIDLWSSLSAAYHLAICKK